jgi:penicillin amidase
MDTEIARARLLKDLSVEQVNFLYPPYPDDRPVIVNHPHITQAADISIEDVPDFMTAINPALLEISTNFLTVDTLTGGGFEGIGSNSWVVSGDLTDTGMPLLANDPHLSSQMPSIWYQVGLHCVELNPDCMVDETGFSFAGAPGVIIGHNNKIAWGLTNLGPDVMDLYIEKINPENPYQYEFNGEWIDMEATVEEIKVAGGDVVEQEVRMTHHGPIITDVYGLDEFADEAGIEFPSNYAISVRWTALEPSCVFCAVWKINIAQNWEEFRSAASDFVVPSQNLVYADVEGNIGYQSPGNIPIRSLNHDGTLPVPGWTGEYEWLGYIPFEDLPYAFNPPEGFIVTANNAVVGSDYPYHISDQWAYGQRAQAIVDLIHNSPEPISIEYISQMQGDNRVLIADDIMPVLMGLSLDDDLLEDARNKLNNWDRQMNMDSASGALFGVFWSNLLSSTFEDDLPEFYLFDGGGRWMEIVRTLLSDPSSPWWDDRSTTEVETRDDIMKLALEGAVKEIQKTQGKDPAQWQWGSLHTIDFEHQVMSSFPFIKNVFNRGPFPTSGGKAIVNATGWSTNGDYHVSTVPSMRMIVDLGNLTNSLTMHTTGQSGHAYHPHYIDMADSWRLIQYYPMDWDINDLASNSEGKLSLVPR